MKRNLGINCHFSANLSPEEALPLIRSAGFTCYSASTADPEEAKRIKAAGDALGLTMDHVYVYIHAIHEMWRRTVAYAPVEKTLCSMIDFAAESGVKTVAFPVTRSKECPGLCEVGLARFDALMLYAAEKGVNLAIENLHTVGNVAYLGDRYRSLPNVGLCYDCGHEHALTGPVGFLDLFHRSTHVVRISDNFGHDELSRDGEHLHLLPFDGTLDYRRMMDKLNHYEYSGALVLEVFQKEYDDLSKEDFLSLAYQKLKELSEWK